MITDYLMKADKAHLFTAKQIDDAIEWAVKEMKEGTVASSVVTAASSEAPVVSPASEVPVVSSGATVASSASTQGTTTASESTTEV